MNIDEIVANLYFNTIERIFDPNPFNFFYLKMI